MSIGVAIVAVCLFMAYGVYSNCCSMTAKLDCYVQTYVDQGLFSGAVLVAKDGEILLCKAYGMANLGYDVPNKIDTKFRIASISKSFTAMAIMKLQEMGLLDVQDLLTKYISDYPNGDKITIHHLLTHTSGIPNFLSSPEFSQKKSTKPHSLEQLVARFKNKPLDFNPGEKYSYCNSGYALLAYIIEKASGETYEAFLKENIFDKLKMKDSGCFDNKRIIKNMASGYTVFEDGLGNSNYFDASTLVGSGNLYSTVKDLYLLDRALYTDTLFSHQTLNKMFTPDKDNYGYGWVVYTSPYGKVIFHNGSSSGAKADFRRYVDCNFCTIVLSNFDNAPEGKIAENLVKIVFGQKPEYPKKRTSIVVNPEVYNQYVGTYKAKVENVLLAFVVTKENDKLFVQDEKDKIEFCPEAENEFFCKLMDLQVSFIKDSGKVTKLILHEGGQDIVAEKIK